MDVYVLCTNQSKKSTYLKRHLRDNLLENNNSTVRVINSKKEEWSTGREREFPCKWNDQANIVVPNMATSKSKM